MQRFLTGLMLAVLTSGALSPVQAQYDAALAGDPPGEQMPAQEFAPPSDSYAHMDAGTSWRSFGSGQGPWFAGVEYRYIRTSFSEAIAFATVSDALGAGGLERSVLAEELDFGFDNSSRYYLGLHIGNCQDIRLSYWNLDADVNVGATADLSQTIVDPFGNLGAAGSSIFTGASVTMNVFDLEYLQTMNFPAQNVDFVYSAGLRFANVRQDYFSVIADGGGDVTSAGVFLADFGGVGPYFSLTGNTSRHRPFSLMAKAGAALLIGDYEVASGVTVPGLATGGQFAERIRAVPVMEAELGASWHPTDRFTVTAGYLFQAWFNLGVSGGTFDGEGLPIAPIDTAFGQTDDADIMSFDGLFVRAELWF